MYRNDTADKTFFPSAALYGDHTLTQLDVLRNHHTEMKDQAIRERNQLGQGSEARSRAERQITKHCETLGMLEDEIDRRKVGA